MGLSAKGAANLKEAGRYGDEKMLGQRVDYRARAGPAKHVPFAPAGEKMLGQRVDYRRLVFWPADHASNLGQGCIGSEELNDAQHRRANARGGGAHQRRDSHEATAIATHDMAEELVVNQQP